MCGIAGAFFFDSQHSQDEVSLTVKKMSDQMKNRGPDSYGYWYDQKTAFGLGHRRLSILDLNSRSDQPMQSTDERYVIVFNGEIYNFKELRLELEKGGVSFQTTGDTEVILKLYAHEKEKMLTRLSGMFTIAIWDRAEKSLFLARDPYGIKPLYYSLNSHFFIFASQVKAILKTDLVSLDPSPKGQAGFWLLGSVPEPHTWFKDINSIEAGTWIKIFSDGKIQTSKYWDIADSWRNAPAVTQTREHVQSVVRKAVSESVKKHLISDVPVGVFLSGGIDSGAIAGLVQDTGVQNMKGITVSFAEFANKHEDESPIAAFVSKKYGFQHHVRQVTKEEFEADLPRILAAMDQPSLDGINTWYATKAVKEFGLKVVLSGVGGDELFYGYPSFSQIPKLVKNMNIAHKIPAATSVIDLLMSAKSKRSNNLRWNYLSQAGRSIFGAYWLRRGVYTPEQLGELMGTELAHEALKKFEIEDLIKSQTGSLSADAGASVGQMESMIYLRNQLLRDSDWASMDHGVELRTPLVDAWLLRDLAAVLRSFNTYRGKELLANSPKYPLDQFIIDRKKTGFGIPLGQWLKTAATKNDYNVTQGGDESRKWAKLVTQSLYQKF